MTEQTPQQPNRNHKVRRGVLTGIFTLGGLFGGAKAVDAVQGDSNPVNQGGSEPTEQVKPETPTPIGIDSALQNRAVEVQAQTLVDATDSTATTPAEVSSTGVSRNSTTGNTPTQGVQLGDATAAVNSDPSGAVGGTPIPVIPGTETPLEDSPDTGFDNSHQDPDGSGTARTPDGGMPTEIPGS